MCWSVEQTKSACLWAPVVPCTITVITLRQQHGLCLSSYRVGAATAAHKESCGAIELMPLAKGSWQFVLQGVTVHLGSFKRPPKVVTNKLTEELWDRFHCAFCSSLLLHCSNAIFQLSATLWTNKTEYVAGWVHLFFRMQNLGWKSLLSYILLSYYCWQVHTT